LLRIWCDVEVPAMAASRAFWHCTEFGLPVFWLATPTAAAWMRADSGDLS
jgi:hypothetical protein